MMSFFFFSFPVIVAYTGTYRPYGEIINDYFVKANEQITDGKTSEEISDAVEEYFDILFGGANKD